jgi:capsule polysaccharide export protein KpsE/RkpR
MSTSTQAGLLYQQQKDALRGSVTWTTRLIILWRHRVLLLRAFIISSLAGVCIVLLIPKEYKSVARIMPPDQQNTSAAILTALAAKAGSLGAIGSLASGLLGTHGTTSLFISLLQSGTVSSHIVDRFQLQHVYHKRYAVDAAKKLAHQTNISDDKKSGVITIEVSDHDPLRARDIAQTYLDELNRIVIQTNTSSAHQERLFVEQRLHSVSADLELAQRELGEFASRNSTVDLKEQTRAMVDAGARVESALVMEQSTLNSLRQIYGDQNLHVREAQARVETLRRELNKVTGTSASASQDTGSAVHIQTPGSDTYPPLRQLPLLAVAYADLYRKVQIEESVFELLTQQYETARIEEAKDIPVVAVIDKPGIPEKKAFPPRFLLALIFTSAGLAGTACYVLVTHWWNGLPNDHELRFLWQEVTQQVDASQGMNEL